ncbi:MULTISPECIES: phosphate ABC transporter substrate-binding protein [Methanobacterium]|jgi:phosphate transport system substrate-binding protein|uniref:Phosphate ABC transporter substrate-binding protein n=1 Tax=Methanobacterium formicicum TaxID=2162 RepID=A0A090JUG7_METFO|nr:MULTISPECIES: phosphate ABC transporter substrate-binding protein [Methanobacterium]KUK75554.1 MAG: Phosphate binding protein [Methanobacterium sp. 42_16]MBF4475822.1 phosphate ABC transporter substrate-binding protein [Methanobacterium formicicum]MDG3548024.1 phosphate ABC transporter substrate-binding protein [Methanobacterium formicicum]MDH2658634.1 phosphate ABC transporter substrate-binding protein [Methanobacterium formicicum]MDI3550304.1 phosphate transport system substrate-binding p
MDTKYIIGIIVAIIVIVGAYFVLAGGSGQEKITIVGSTSVQPVAEKLATEYMKKNSSVKITVQGGGSSVGIKSVQDGSANIGTSSKSLKANESTGLSQYEIGKDGIAIIVNNNNALSGLTMEQLKGILSGNITNWKEVGGPDAKINVVVREEGSGTRDAVQEIVLGKLANGTKVDFIKSAIVQSSTEAVQQSVAQDPNAIGFISFASVNGTKALQINNVAPSEATVLDGTYKIQRPFLFLIKGDATGAVKAFIDWVDGPEGQAIIKSENVVPTGVQVNSTS